jgi:hydrophobe/amphiphile efflux-3 (HAE3) family protein
MNIQSVDGRPRGPLAWLGRLVAARPVLCLVGVLVVTAALSPFLFRLRAEADMMKMLPEHDPGLVVMAQVDSEFGGSDEVAVVVESRELFTQQTLAALDSLTEALAAVAGVTEVQGLTTLQDVKGQGDDVVISRVIDSVPTEPGRLAALREQVLADERYAGSLVSTDGTSALLLARLSPGVVQERVVADIEQVVARSSLARQVSLSGAPAMMKYMRDWMASDMVKLLPLVVLVLVLVLLLVFRSWYGVLLPMAAVLIALVWTLGLVGLFGQPITIVMVVLPPVLVSVGSAYGIHIIERWESERRSGLDSRQAVRVAVGNTGLPVFLAMATTVAGFGSNFMMKIASIRAFSVFSVLGIAFSFVLALVFVPAVLAMVRKGAKGARGEEDEAKSQEPRANRQGEGGGRNGGDERRRGRWFGAWGAWAFSHPWVVILAAAVLTALSVFAARRVHPETDFVRYFKPGSGPTRAAAIVNERFGGMMQFEFVVTGDICDTAVLGQMERFERVLKQVPHVSQVYSIADVLGSTNKAFNSGKPEFDRVPESRDAVAQYLLLLSFSGSDFISRLITSDYQVARITARFDRQESGEIARAMKLIRAAMAEYFPDGGPAKVSVGGMPIAVLALHESIQTNQVWSVVTAVVAVFLLVAVLFRSVGLGLAAMLPILFTLAVSFGVMGIGDIQVDVVTAMLGSIAVGIGIDYSCHLIARYREEQAAGAAGAELIRRTLARVGPAIAANALAVGLGFAVLLFSSLSVIQKFGVLVAGTMLYSSVGALALLAAVLSLRRKDQRRQM